MENAIAYRRVSITKQDGSLETQERRLDQYCAYTQLEITANIPDNDTCAEIPVFERPGGRALLSHLKAGRAKHLVVAKLDRLFRNSLDFLITWQILEAMGVTLHIADEGGCSLSTMGHWGKFFLLVRVGAAEAELNEIRDRTRKRFATKREKGELTGNVPYGADLIYTFADAYTRPSDKAFFLGGEVVEENGNKVNRPPDPEIAPLILAHGAVISKKLQPNPLQLATLRRMRQLRYPHWPNTQVTGLKLAAIAELLNGNREFTKLGKPWSCGTVDSVLHSKSTAQLLVVSSK